MTKYTEDKPKELIKLMTDGALDCEVYAQWDICKDTFYTWINEHEEFKAAHDIGLSKCEAWWTARMRERFLAGDDKGFKYCIAIMNNKFGWERGAKQDTMVTNNYQIGNINVLQQLGRDGLIKNIQKQLGKNPELIEVIVEPSNDRLK